MRKGDFNEDYFNKVMEEVGIESPSNRNSNDKINFNKFC
jgi:hypothetical protein